MIYPLLSEYLQAIKLAEDNFDKLSNLRPILSASGEPIYDQGNFAVVFKMKDITDGKVYAIKCFLKEQADRENHYRMICNEIKKYLGISYLVPMEYISNELYVDSRNSNCQVFPVVKMPWIEGQTLEKYIRNNYQNPIKLKQVLFQFSKMASWLLYQPFAHGDLKPDNIIVQGNGDITLIDYDGMFVPEMVGQKATEIGSPDYRHPARTDNDFDLNIDDFSIIVLALTIKVICLNPSILDKTGRSDGLVFVERDFLYPDQSKIIKIIKYLTYDIEINVLLNMFFELLRSKIIWDQGRIIEAVSIVENSAIPNSNPKIFIVDFLRKNADNLQYKREIVMEKRTFRYLLEDGSFFKAVGNNGMYEITVFENGIKASFSFTEDHFFNLLDQYQYNEDLVKELRFICQDNYVERLCMGIIVIALARAEPISDNFKEKVNIVLKNYLYLPNIFEHDVSFLTSEQIDMTLNGLSLDKKKFLFIIMSKLNLALIENPKDLSNPLKIAASKRFSVLFNIANKYNLPYSSF